MRKAGILMPVASIPSAQGCGTFGPEAKEFVDLSRSAGFQIWQILPLNPLGYGNSPYQPYSSNAMDDLYISLTVLQREGLIQRKIPSFHKKAEWIDYEAVRAFRESYLREAFSRFVPDEDYGAFVGQKWVQDYAAFMTFKKKNDLKCWNEWENPEEKNYPYLKEKPVLSEEDEKEMKYQMFLQYELYVQWNRLKKYANGAGIEIMGDVPFYVGVDSVDVWASRENFLLDDDGRPSFIAGVPPDYFSATGQRWGNPIYDWDYMEKDGFHFWINRFGYSAKLFDLIRVDHFRAFDTYWKIPASCPTAMEGEWIEAPGYALFDKLFEVYPKIQIIAEDLGDLRPEVLKLRDHYNFRGMRVIQFSFDPNGMPEDPEHLLVYSGTHDNPPIWGWYEEKPEKEKRAIRKYLYQHGYRKKSFTADVIDYSLDSKADMVVIPMFDWLHLDAKRRLNRPGTVGGNNWRWRMTSMESYRALTREIYSCILKSGRAW